FDDRLRVKEKSLQVESLLARDRPQNHTGTEYPQVRILKMWIRCCRKCDWARRTKRRARRLGRPINDMTNTAINESQSLYYLSPGMQLIGNWQSFVSQKAGMLLDHKCSFRVAAAKLIFAATDCNRE